MQSFLQAPADSKQNLCPHRVLCRCGLVVADLNKRGVVSGSDFQLLPSELPDASQPILRPSASKSMG